MNENLTALLLLVIILAFAVGVLEVLSRKNILGKETGRKLLHIFAGMVVVICPNYITDINYLYAAGIIVAIGTFTGITFNLFPAINEKNRKSWGIFYYPVSFLFLMIIWGEDHLWLMRASFLILAFADAFAAIAGSRFARSYYKITADKKSVTGSVVFFITAFAVIMALTNEFVAGTLTGFGSPAPLSVYHVMFAFSAAVILTMFEASSSRGLDNITVPVFASILLYVFLKEPNPDLLINFNIGLLLAGAAAVISYRVRFLTLDGAAGTFLLAAFIFGLGGWKWTVPILTFFVLSSIFSKIRKGVNERIEERFDKTGQRDMMQVIANGGLGGLLVIIYQVHNIELIYFLYVSILAAVCSDTWATEIGTMIRSKTYHILKFKEVEQGTSGGVSVFGTLGAIAGAAVIALSSMYWIGSLELLAVIAGAGFAGSIIDSIMGATAQAQYKCSRCDLMTEKKLHCSKPAEKVSGFLVINNDTVNLLAGLGSGLILYIYFLL